MEEQAHIKYDPNLLDKLLDQGYKPFTSGIYFCYHTKQPFTINLEESFLE